jgi:hypothetical protein
VSGNNTPTPWIKEASGLEVATVEHDEFSLVEIVKSPNTRAARLLTIHRLSEDTGRREDLTIDLTEDQALRVADALTESPRTASEAFADWLNKGPKLALAAGCHVGIKVTGAKPSLSGSKE